MDGHGDDHLNDLAGDRWSQAFSFRPADLRTALNVAFQA
jgi:hypothetical protein